jgi:nitrogen fixation NifU-like protein
MKMALNFQRRQPMEKPDGYGKRTGACGDTVEIFLRIRGGMIQTVFYLTDGCLNTNACANTVAHLAEGRSIAQAWNLTSEDITYYLETLPQSKTHCAELAIGAFYLALVDDRRLRRNPWKKAYR